MRHHLGFRMVSLSLMFHLLSLSTFFFFPLNTRTLPTFLENSAIPSANRSRPTVSAGTLCSWPWRLPFVL